MDYSAADRVEGDQLEITKSPCCGDVWKKVLMDLNMKSGIIKFSEVKDPL